MIWVAVFGLALVQTGGAAEEQKGELKTQREKVSYSIGMMTGNNLKRGSYDIDVDIMTAAMKDVLAGKELKMTEQQAREVLSAYQKEMNAKREEERIAKAEKNRKEGEAFLADNKTKPGIKTHVVTLPDGKTAEMQYKVITEGTGSLPKSNDIVTVNYRGTFINGTEFDSSAKAGAPLKRPLNMMIRGWTEALQMMKTGSKWTLFIPSSLAYGDRGYGPTIEPGATLIFDVDLVSAEAAPAPAPAQPLTSDIIKVPSAEELKKGAKIEVIKPEDVEKKIKESQAQEKTQQKTEEKKQ